MKWSIVGTGRMGKGLARTLAPVMNDLSWGSRDVGRLQEIINHLGLTRIKAVAVEEALKADIIVHTLWFRDLIPWVQEHREALKGKILVDISNPFTADFTDFVTEWGTSAAEELQRAVPETIVVGAFKNTFFEVLNNPVHNGLKSDVYVTGDNEEAKRTVMEALLPIPFRVYDGGSLKNNRTIERMTLFERELAIRYGHYPYVSFRLFGSPNE